MKKSHSHYQSRRNKSVATKRNNSNFTCKSIKDYEKPNKVDTIFNFYNNSNIINSDMEMDESTLGDIEYAKTLQLALKDAINQNEKLSEELNKCIKENKELREEIEEKDNVIYELSQYYQFCQNNHINNNDDADNNDTDYKIGSKKKKNQRAGKIKKRSKCIAKPVNDN
jgi:hypothetical protein